MPLKIIIYCWISFKFGASPSHLVITTFCIPFQGDFLCREHSYNHWFILRAIFFNPRQIRISSKNGSLCISISPITKICCYYHTCFCPNQYPIFPNLYNVKGYSRWWKYIWMEKIANGPKKWLYIQDLGQRCKMVYHSRLFFCSPCIFQSKSLHRC